MRAARRPMTAGTMLRAADTTAWPTSSDTDMIIAALELETAPNAA